MDKLQYVKIFKALADETRLMLLQRISETEEICVCKLMEEFSMAQSKLSYHLKMLLAAQLISVRPCGKWNFYTVNNDLLQQLFQDAVLKKLLKK